MKKTFKLVLIFVGGMVADASNQVINDGGVTGAVGMTIDVLRNRKNQKQSSKK